MVAETGVSVPRVVLDTNVVLSALLFKSGRVGWLVPLWTSGRIVPIVSKATACELIRVLAYPKFKLGESERQAVLAAFLPYAETVKTRAVAAGARCRDPHDEMFLTLAAHGRADFLVTGDADLLSVEAFPACPIITPDQFRRKLSDV
jgi:putative PIN family toxin of toxin-antitoxin system